MTTDVDLLRQFAHENSQDAFGEIVRRHVNLVYSAALRQARSPQLAEEIAQSVFTDLARDARKLKADTILTAWLYAVARRTAVDVIRKESRRQLREQIAVEMNNMNATADDWTQIAPLLDDAMAALDETDRTAVLLRYFENKSLREVGDSLRISDDAAQKRVSRAVDQLREFFTKRRLTIGAATLVTLISANAVQSAPIGFAATILSTTTTTTLGMTMLHKILITGLAAATAATVIYAVHMQNQIGSLQQQQTSLQGQIAQLEQERNDATNQLAGLQDENARLRAGQDDLLRLRGEVTRLRNQRSVSQDSQQANTNNTPVIQIHLKAWFVSIPTEDVPSLGIEWIPASQQSSGKTGLLLESQFRPLLKALNEASDVNLIGEPEVTSLNGQQTEMRATRPYSWNGTNVELGAVFDSKSYFATNLSLFTMNLDASLILLNNDSSQSAFQVIQVTNEVALSPIQVAVMEADIPTGNSLPVYTNAAVGPQTLLVFAVPTVIDAAGNRVPMPKNFRVEPTMTKIR
jgi:RNA polymerase sigma factor (sigma-70 family)